MTALRITTGVCAPLLLLAACAAGHPAARGGEPAGTSAPASGASPLLRSRPGPSGTPVGQVPVDLGTVTGVFHRVGGPLGSGGQQPRAVPLKGRMRFDRPGYPAVTIVVGRSGRFTAELAPGVYRVTGITPDIVEVLDNGRQLDGRCPGPRALRVRAGKTGRITVTCAVP